MKRQGRLSGEKSRKTFFGGTLLKKSHAKVARPLSTRKPMHLVLRSSRARGGWNLLQKHNVKILRQILRQQAKHFRITVLAQANGGNHLHLLIRGKTKEELRNFIRTISALIARYVQKVHKGSAAQKGFWDQRPFTRIVEGYKGLRVATYIIQNELEALGVIPYVSRLLRFSSA